jgi:putative molybdopterin biosynthesis protein
VLLAQQLSETGMGADAMTMTVPARTEVDAALAVVEGQADAAFGLQAIAAQFRLEFIPVIRERFDLLVWRREWFEPPVQQLLKFTRSPRFRERAEQLSGYDISGLGNIHFNAR